MKFLSLEKLSKNMHVDNSGYLICENAILARTGKQQYRHNELFQDSDDDSIINVDRPEKEVFDEKTLASFENKPICDEHPEDDVTPVNYRELSVGFVRDIHRGMDNGQPVMMGTLVITDAEAIEEVMAGKRQLSCGYDCELQDGDNGMYQCHIRGNHVALCEEGRAGIARIVDSKTKDTAMTITTQCYIFDGDKILIQNRIGPAWKGLAVPGGHVQINEKVENSCIREVREETGLTVGNLELFGTHEYVSKDEGQCIAMLYKTSSFNGELHGSEEGDVMWMPIEEVLTSNDCADGFKELLQSAISTSVKDSVKDSMTMGEVSRLVQAMMKSSYVKGKYDDHYDFTEVVLDRIERELKNRGQYDEWKKYDWYGIIENEIERNESYYSFNDSIVDRTYKEYFIPKGSKIEGFNSCQFGANKNLIPGPSFVITSKDIKAFGIHSAIEQVAVEFDKKYGTPKGTRWSPEGLSKYVTNIVNDSVNDASSYTIRYKEQGNNPWVEETFKSFDKFREHIFDLGIGTHYTWIMWVKNAKGEKVYSNGPERLSDIEKELSTSMKDSIVDSYDISYNLGHATKTEHFDNKKEADERYEELLQLSKKPSMSGLDVKKLYKDSVNDAVKVGAKYKNSYGTIAEIDSFSTYKTYVNVIFTRKDGSQDVKTMKTADVERILYDNTYRLIKDSVKDAVNTSDLIRFLKNTSIKEGEVKEYGNTRTGLYIQLQNHGKSVHEEITQYPRVSPKEVSACWIRIWKDGKLIYMIDDQLNLAKIQAIKFLNGYSVTDSIKDADMTEQYKKETEKQLSKWGAKEAKIWKETNWKARNYKPLLLGNNSFKKDVKVVGTDIVLKNVKFVLEISPNPIFEPRYVPEGEYTTYKDYSWTADATKHNGYTVIGRADTWKNYNAMTSDSNDKTTKLEKIMRIAKIAKLQKRGK